MAHSKPIDRITVHGTTDEITTCEHCGRTGLKATVALSIDDGPVVNFGRDCAATALKVGKASINAAIREFEKAERTAAEAAHSAQLAEENAVWFAFLAQHGSERPDAIEALGGFTAARTAFEASR